MAVTTNENRSQVAVLQRRNSKAVAAILKDVCNKQNTN